MLIVHQNGDRSTPKVTTDFNGLAIETVTLDIIDVKELEKLFRKPGRQLTEFVSSLSDAMVKKHPEQAQNSGLVYHDDEEDSPTKPPLGLVPHIIWVDKRKADILAAIDRYEEVDLTVPSSWKKELESLNSYISESE